MRCARIGLPSLVLAHFVACAGNEFSSAGETIADGGSSVTQAGSSAGGRGGGSSDDVGNDAGADVAASGSGTTLGGNSGSAGDGSGSVSGAGGSGVAPNLVCDEGGQEFQGHCYVESIALAPNGDDALARCNELASELGRQAYPVAIESGEEQQWLIDTFLTNTKQTHDLWLGLRCPEDTHPDASVCFCRDCAADQLAAARTHWAWHTQASYGAGWKLVNPDGDGRCAALSYDAGNGFGWVDRDCAQSQYLLAQTTIPRTYRVVCEVE